MTKINRYGKLIGCIASGMIILLQTGSAPAATGFGSREQLQHQVEAPIETAEAAEASRPTRVNLPVPAEISGVEWLKVPYDKAESEVLALFHRDLAKLEAITGNVIVYEVKTSGMLPPGYDKKFRHKLERVLLSSKVIKLKECRRCEEARLVRDENGQIRYERYNTDMKAAAKIASDVDARHLVFAELDYHPTDLQLRLRLVDPGKNEIDWSKEYSAADVVSQDRGKRDTGLNSDEVGQGDSLARVLIGEIAFTTVVSSGVAILPTVNRGTGSAMSPSPMVDLFIGEKFDRGKKTFGFQLGMAMSLGSGQTKGMPLPWAFRLAPQYKYNFNPYDVTTARISAVGEGGLFMSTGLTTGYIGAGAEFSMINRFSVSLMPIYVVAGSVSGTQDIYQGIDGNYESSPASKIGDYGGLGFILKGNINW